MKLVITDVSVLFDLFHIKILSEFFVYDEIVNQEQIKEFEEFRQTGKLIVLDLSQEEEEQVINFKTKRNLKSIPDKTMLWKAIQLNCPLLTCDAKLRKEAIDNGIQVHGSIWVLLALEKEKLIEKQRMIALLEQIKLVNNRLPMVEIDKIMKRLKENE